MITVTPIEAFKDNYHWLIEGQDKKGQDETWVVDPGDGAKVKDVLAKKSKNLSGILITHHHWDHVDGIEELMSDDLIVVGPAQDKHPLVNTPLTDGDLISVCNIDFKVIAVPGHTLNHLAYFASHPHGSAGSSESQVPVLFSGDTLFAGGCGRLFEGSPSQMHQSLSKFSHLPKQTQVYCAHEYTLANLEFALSLEPNNLDLIERAAESRQQRNEGKPTIPSTISIELKTNPFMRVESIEFLNSVETQIGKLPTDPASIFASIRALKDNF